MEDDVQLPPPRSASSNHGRLVWTTFDSAVELTKIVRQTESEQQLRGVLMSSRTYNTKRQQIHWLQKFQWHNLRLTRGTELLGRMDEQGLYVFQTHRLKGERNKTKQLECNRKRLRHLTMVDMQRRLRVVRHEGCYHYCIFAQTSKSCW